MTNDQVLAKFYGQVGPVLGQSSAESLAGTVLESPNKPNQWISIIRQGNR